MPIETADASATSGHQPRISVICSFFNVKPYLAEMIESVLSQDYANFEFVLVDDGSTDGSTQIAKAATERHADRVIYLDHPNHANRGVSAGRNLGLAHVTGEFVSFIDGDDRWVRSKLTEQAELFERHPQLDAVFGAARYWSSYQGGADEIIQSGHARNRAIAPPEALLKVYPLGQGTAPCLDLLVRRRVIQKIGGFEEEFVGPLFLYEDQAFLTKLYLNATIMFSDRVWLDYRIHPASCTQSGIRDGLGWNARQYCLEWLEAYLAKSSRRHDPRIRWALFKALRPYRHPHVTKLGRALKNLLRTLTRRQAARA